MTQEQYLDVIVGKLDQMQHDLNALLQTQQVNNLLAVANNMQVSEEIRREALDQAMKLIDLPSMNRDVMFR